MVNFQALPSLETRLCTSVGDLCRVLELATRSYSLFPLIGLATCFNFGICWAWLMFVIFVWCLWTEQLSRGHIRGLLEFASMLGSSISLPAGYSA